MKIALDTDFFSFSQIREIAPFVIKPNMKEAENILSRSGITARDAFGAASLLAEAAEHVLLSMGAQGICYHHRQEGLRVRVPAVAVSSTVGAGDTALAGFLAMIQQGKNLPDSVRYAAACSCASVTLEGTQGGNESHCQPLFDSDSNNKASDVRRHLIQKNERKQNCILILPAQNKKYN